MAESEIKRCGFDPESCMSSCLKDPGFLEQVRKIYESGELLVYPTETLYALGANPFNENALVKLYEAKRRPGNMPVSVAVSGLEMMYNLVEVTELAKVISDRFLPGPVTLLLRKKADLPPNLALGTDMLGIRVPDNQVARGLIGSVGPITATSANIHGQPDPRTVDEAYGQLGEYVALYIDCGICRFGEPSTVVDCSGTSAKVIRKGVISRAELESVIP